MVLARWCFLGVFVTFSLGVKVGIITSAFKNSLSIPIIQEITGDAKYQNTQFEIHMVSSLTDLDLALESFKHIGVDFLIDNSASISYLKIASHYCHTIETIHFVLFPGVDCSKLTRVSFCNGWQPSDEALTIGSLVNSFEFHDVAFITSSSPLFGQFSTHFTNLSKHLGFNLVSTMTYDLGRQQYDQSYSKNFTAALRHQLKIHANFVVVLCTDLESSGEIFQTLPSDIISGFAWFTCSQVGILSQSQDKDGNHELLRNGMITPLARDNLGSTVQYTNLSATYGLQEAIELILDLENKTQEYGFANGIHSFSLLLQDQDPLSRFNFKYINHMRDQAWSIINIQSDNLVAVGQIQRDFFDKINQSQLVWPGSEDKKPDGSVFTLKFTRGNWVFGDSVEVAFDLAISQVNDNKIDELSLPFKLDPVSIMFSTSFVQAEIEEFIDDNRQALHSGVVALMNTGTAIQYSFAFQKMGITNPLIVTPATGAPLSNSNVHPNTFRTTQSDAVFAEVFSFVLRSFGWSHLCLLIEDAPFQRDLRQIMLSKFAEIGITLMADKVVPPLFFIKREELQPKVVKTYGEMREARCRIFFTIAYSASARELVALKYDLNIYGKHFLELGSNFTFRADYGSKEQQQKVEAVMEGSVGVEEGKYVGAIGLEVQSRIKQMLNGADINDFAYFAYDNMLLYAHAIQYCLQNNMDYESHDDLREAIQRSSFQGTTGEVKIQSGDTHDRRWTPYYVFNIQESRNVRFAKYDPEGEVVFQVYGTPIWPGNQKERPIARASEDFDCPFYDHEAEPNYYDRDSLFFASGYILATAAIAALVIWKRMSNVRFAELTEIYRMSLMDVSMAAEIILEALQIMSLGPRFDFYAGIVATIAAATKLDFAQLINLEKEAFWYILLMVLLFFCLLIIAVSFQKINEQIKWLKRGNPFLLIAENYTWVIVKIGLIPILSTVLEVYSCDISVSWNGDTKLYLSRDCFTECSGSRYQSYVIIGTFVVVLYPPLALYLSEVYQMKRNSLIKESPQFLVAKMMVLFSLIIMDKLLGQNPTFHAFVFSLSIAGYTIYCFRSQTMYNTEEFRILQRSTLMAVLWEGVTTSMSYNILTKSHTLWAFLLLLGWGMIAIFALFKIQEQQSLYFTFDIPKCTSSMYTYYFASQLSALSEEKIQKIFREAIEFRDAAVKLLPQEDTDRSTPRNRMVSVLPQADSINDGLTDRVQNSLAVQNADLEELGVSSDTRRLLGKQG